MSEPVTMKRKCRTCARRNIDGPTGSMCQECKDLRRLITMIHRKPPRRTDGEPARVCSLHVDGKGDS